MYTEDMPPRVKDYDVKDWHGQRDHELIKIIVWPQELLSLFRGWIFKHMQHEVYLILDLTDFFQHLWYH